MKSITIHTNKTSYQAGETLVYTVTNHLSKAAYIAHPRRGRPFAIVQQKKDGKYSPIHAVDSHIGHYFSTHHHHTRSINAGKSVHFGWSGRGLTLRGIHHITGTFQFIIPFSFQVVKKGKETHLKTPLRYAKSASFTILK
jgi:hypothetical protein